MAADHDHNYTTIDRAHHVETLTAVGEHAARKKKQAKKRKKDSEDKHQAQEEEMMEHSVDNKENDEGHIDFKA
jgi:hypothetical protein